VTVQESYLASARRFTRISFGAGIFTAVVGAVALLGWALAIEPLKSIVGSITMKANAAVALVLCGVSLALTVRGPSRIKPIASALAILAATIGGLTLTEHVVGWNLGIDELLFKESPGAAATTSPGRMGPNAATSLLLAGIAIAALYRDSAIAVRRTQMLAGVIAIFATVPVLGYGYGAQQLYNVAQYTGIALPTAVSLLVLSLGILTVRPEMGLMAVFSGAGAGGVLARRLLVPAIVLPLTLGYVRVLGQNANLYDTGLGTAMFAITITTLFVLLVWRTAVQLNAVDAERERAERQQEQLLEREQTARAEVEHANRLKDHFLATLSHELRTPLNAILGYARMLRSGAIPLDKRTRAIEVIERNATAQNQLVDDLLDMSRMTTGRIRLEKELIPIIQPLQEALESIRPIAEAKGVAVDVNTDPFAGNVHGDEGRLRQVFWNLLSNAVKFTPPGGRVHVGLESTNDSVRVTFRDTGIGIQPSFLPHIFEPFRQADGGSTRRYSGLGLGLAICKQLVELHGGSIAAESGAHDRGASFVVHLPRQVLEESHRDASEPSRSLRAPSESLTGRTLTGIDVLVVDDEHDNLELARQLLENAGATVRTAANAVDALRELDRRNPHLLVADIGMPEVDGFELLRQVRARSRDIPAVAVTASAKSDDRLRTLSAGFTDHIAKPIDPNEFIKTLTAAIQHTQVKPGATASTATGQRPDGSW
jgi:signal transduction histidine kinase/ActR/RegA family two-component response regulator